MFWVWSLSFACLVFYWLLALRSLPTVSGMLPPGGSKCFDLHDVMVWIDEPVLSLRPRLELWISQDFLYL